MRKLLLAGLVLVAGCQVIDTGVVDFRRAETLTADRETELKTEYLAGCVFRDSGADGLQACDPMLPSRLHDKFETTPGNFIRTNDTFSIRLDFGVVADMAEWPKLTSRGLKTNGEIAILVNAFEVSDETGGGRFYDFQQVDKASTDDLRGLGEFANAKVVYFNPDVDEGQSLNLSNIPVMGPVKYEGRPIGLQIIVIELDRMTPATRALLQKLAELGKAQAVVGGEATDALFELGKSMINGAQDDVIFEYRMLMDNGSHLKAQNVSAFQRGQLVFRRAQQRQNTLVWGNLVLDQNTGALFVAGKPELQQIGRPAGLPETVLEEDSSALKRVDYSPYVRETYFTFNVINHGPDGPVGVYEHKRWGEVSKAFDDYLAATENSGVTGAGEKLDNLIAERKSLNAHGEIARKIDDAIGRWQAYGVGLVPQAPETGPNDTFMAQTFKDFSALQAVQKERCSINYKALLAEMPNARLQRGLALAATNELIDLLLAGRPDDKEEKDKPLQRKEFNLAINRLWREAVGKLQIQVTGEPVNQTDNEEKFRDGAAFATAFLAADKRDALPDLLQKAAAALEAKSCATLITRRPG